jgi:hypothetical protein
VFWGKTGNLTANAMTGVDICRAMEPQLEATGLPDEFPGPDHFARRLRPLPISFSEAE